MTRYDGPAVVVCRSPRSIMARSLRALLVIGGVPIYAEIFRFPSGEGSSDLLGFSTSVS